MKMIEHNHFICHLILGTFTEYPFSESEDSEILLYDRSFCQKLISHSKKSLYLKVIKRDSMQQK